MWHFTGLTLPLERHTSAGRRQAPSWSVLSLCLNSRREIALSAPRKFRAGETRTCSEPGRRQGRNLWPWLEKEQKRTMAEGVKFNFAERVRCGEAAKASKRKLKAPCRSASGLFLFSLGGAKRVRRKYQLVSFCWAFIHKCGSLTLRRGLLATQLPNLAISRAPPLHIQLRAHHATIRRTASGWAGLGPRRLAAAQSSATGGLMGGR